MSLAVEETGLLLELILEGIDEDREIERCLYLRVMQDPLGQGGRELKR